MNQFQQDTLDRRAFMRLVALGALSAPLGAEAQQVGKIPRIGYLDFGSPPGVPPIDTFRQELRDLGYFEGQNIAIEYRWAAGSHNKLADFAAELVRLNVDAIVAMTTPAALAAKRATNTIPIVIGRVADPVGTGIVASLARPGGNVTGWSHLPGPQFAAKRLEVLKEAVPAVTRVAALWNPANPSHEQGLKVVTIAARTMGLQLEPLGVRDADALENAFSTIAKQRAEALYVFPDGLFSAQRKRIVGFAAKSRLPALYGAREYPEAGGLMAYGANLADRHRRTAYFLDKLLRGAKPADLPIELPTTFELVINLKTAKALGLKIPQSLLLRADQVIQ